MKRLLKIVAIAFAVLVLFALSVPLWLDANHFRPMLESELSSALGRAVKLGDLKLAIFSGSVTANDLAIADDPAFSKDAFVKAKSLNVQVELLPLILSRSLHVTGIVIDGPEIVVIQDPSGRWNFSSLAAGSEKPKSQAPAGGSTNLDLSVKLVRITNGRFTFERAGMRRKPSVLEAVGMELRDFSVESSFPFSFSGKMQSGGQIQLDGKVGPLDKNDVSITPAQVNLKVAQFDVARSNLLGNAPISGIVSFDGSAESSSGTITANGKVTAQHIKLAPQGTAAPTPLTLDFVVQHDLRKFSGVVKRGDVHIGKALASMTGTYSEHGETMNLHMKFSARNMPVPDLASMLPAIGIALPLGSTLQAGTATAEFTADGPADAVVTAGTMDFEKAKLAGFDLPKKMASIEKLAGIKSSPDLEIETLSAKIHMGPDGIETEELKLLVTSIGQITGAGKVSATRELDFKMTAAVQTGGVAAIVRNEPIPFTVTGTCAEPVFKPDLKAVVKEEIKGVGKDVEKAAGGLLKGILGGGKHQ
jgi:AsmA protein